MSKDVYVDGLYVCSCELTTSTILDLEDIKVDTEAVLDIKITNDKVQIRTDKVYAEAELS